MTATQPVPLLHKESFPGESMDYRAALSYGFLRSHAWLYPPGERSHAWPSFRLPHRLVEEAGRHGCEIVLSFYGPPGGE